MRATPRNAFNVGLVTIVASLAAFCLLIWISKGIGGDMKPVTIRFRVNPDMPTLVPGSVILVGGQKVGKVVEATLVKQPIETDKPNEQDFYVLVRAEVLRLIEPREDCSAVAEGPPLGGDGLIKLDLGRSTELLKEGAVIEGARPGGFGAVLASLQGELNGEDPTSLLGQIKAQLDPRVEASLMAKILRSMDDLNGVTRSIHRELSSEERAAILAKLHRVVDNINVTTAELRAQMQPEHAGAALGKVHAALDALNDSLMVVARVLHESEPPVRRTLASVESTAQKLDTRILENVSAQLDPARADGLVAKLNSAADRMNRSLDDLNAVTGATRQLVILNRENLDKMILNLKETSDHLKSASKYVLAHPWRLLNAPSEKETRQQAIFDAARNFAEAANRLDDSTARIAALAELHGGRVPTDGQDWAEVRAGLQAAFTKFRAAEEALWKQLEVK